MYSSIKTLHFEGQTDHTAVKIPSIPKPDKECSPKSMNAKPSHKTHVWLHNTFDSLWLEECYIMMPHIIMIRQQYKRT